MVNILRCLFAFAAFSAIASAQKFYTYIGNLSSDSSLIAWGTLDGVNTIGRSSPSHGEATIRIDGRAEEDERRTEYLKRAADLRVLRVGNDEVLYEREAVLMAILRAAGVSEDGRQ